jgi:hypothetical protein
VLEVVLELFDELLLFEPDDDADELDDEDEPEPVDELPFELDELAACCAVVDMSTLFMRR